MTFPVEMYHEQYYRLAHGPEEFAKLAAQGWVDVKPEGHKYIPHSAASVVHKPEPVVPLFSIYDASLGAPEEPVKRGPGRPPKDKSDEK